MSETNISGTPRLIKVLIIREKPEREAHAEGAVA